MSGFDRLKEIGAQKIHEKTHIAKQHVQAVLHESFDGMNKIQFLGFVSILEREYGLILDDLRASGLHYYEEQSLTTVEPKKKVFLVPKKKKNYIPIYVSVVIVIFAVVAYFTLLPLSFMLDGTKIQEIDNSAIESAKSNISLVEEKLIADDATKEEVLIQEQNTTKQEQILPAKEPKQAVLKKEVFEVKEVVASENTKIKETESMVQDTQVTESVKSLKVIPKSKIWMGYIDLKTHRKYQRTFKDEFEMDAKKDWLMLLGHGYVDIEVDGVITKFNSRNNLRFLYKDGNLTKIDTPEFKNLNNGSKW